VAIVQHFDKSLKMCARKAQLAEQQTPSRLMHKLKGSGATFSTSGKHWRPFRANSTILRQKARLRRLQANGLAPQLTKAAARQLCDQAAASHPIRRIDP
jgi:hypothetical protein